MGPPHAIRHSRESGDPGAEVRSRVLDPRFRGGDDKRGDLAHIFGQIPSHDLLGDFVVAPMPDALPSLIVWREEAPSAGATGVFE
jgi:hypothetical protein